MNKKLKATPLTEELIDSFPAVDPHVHVPGTISPRTAWDLGIRNKLITVKIKDDPEHPDHGKWVLEDGPNKLGKTDPVKKYSRLFCSHGPKGALPLQFSKNGTPRNLDYDYDCIKGDDEKHDTFKGFDAIQGTTQGHRHRPGGIQNEDDYRFVMQRFLESCLAQNIRYVEPSQNITIAEVLYPDLGAKEARMKFFQLAKELVDEFAKKGVTLRFTHCANKTGAANVSKSLKVRTHEWADWLAEANAQVPGVFVGLTTAGHEKMEIEAGGPRAMVDGYQRVADMGMGCEGHYGEGAGVEHMMKAMDLLPQGTRFAHGIQVIESQDAIDMVRKTGLPLVMAPYINLSLGGVIHYKDGKPHHKLHHDPKTGRPIVDSSGKPMRVEGIENHYIESLEDHPIWPLMREHGLAIGLMSDDPQQGGIDYKDQVKLLAGIGSPRNGINPVCKPDFKPLTAEELTLCNLNALQAAFCEPEVKKQLANNIREWAKQHAIEVNHPLLDTKQTGWKQALAPSARGSGTPHLS